MPAKKAPAEAAAPVKKPAARKPAVRKTKGITEEMIRERAYYLSTERSGSPEDHWLAAERELNGAKK